MSSYQEELRKALLASEAQRKINLLKSFTPITASSAKKTTTAGTVSTVPAATTTGASPSYASQRGNLQTITRSTLPTFADLKDFAPIKTVDSLSKKDEEEEGGLDFFQKSKVFSDGYDVGDITKTILGTAGDVGVNAVHGLLNMVEGVGDALLYGASGLEKATEGITGRYGEAERLKKMAQENTMDDGFKDVEDFLDRYSVLGRTSKSVAQGVGQVGGMIGLGAIGGAVGLGAAGTTALTTGTMGVSGFGSGMGEAYKAGATDEEAVTYGIISGAADSLSELLFGGLGKAVNAVGFSKGLSSVDDMLAKKVSGLFQSQLTKNIAEYGIKAGAEGFEEVVAGTAQAIGKKLTYMSEEEFSEILEDENLLEQFVVGAVTSGIAQAPGLNASNKTKTDFITGQTQNEQAVVKKEVENRIAEQEKDGKKLSAKEKSAIEAQVEKDLERGYISTDTIEEVLGGDSYKAYKDTVDSEDAILKEFDSLYKMKTGDMTGEQIDRLAELKQKAQDIKSNSQRSQLKQQLGDTVKEMVKSDRLIESYNEKARAFETFRADFDKFKGAKHEDAAKKTLESAVKAEANNTNRIRDLVEMAAKISGDTGLVFEFSGSKQIKANFIERQNNEIAKIESIPEAERTAEQNAMLTEMKNLVAKVESGKTKIHGEISGSGIVLNLDSPKPLNRTVGHEVTHSLETAKSYEGLRDTLFAYAKEKGVDVDGELATLKAQYAGVTNANPEAELVADLVGDFLFTDPDFASNLATKNRNIFQKIYDEIKYLVKIATAGSKEARELEKVKRAFEKAYKEAGKAQADTKYSMTVQDKETLDSLNEQVSRGEYDAETNPNGGYYTTYKSMSFWGYDEDGNAILRSPMAEYVDGKLSDAYLIPKEKGKFNWYQATETIDEKTGFPAGLLVMVKEPGKKSPKYLPAAENQHLIKDDWSNLYFNLRKKVMKNGKWETSDVPARYNPYEHSSNSMLNDQFSAAYLRDNLVTVKMIVPVSEDNGAFRAQWSKDATGWTDWKSGIVAGKIGKQKDLQRRVYLSRYAAPVEIVPDSEVAKAYKGYLEGTDVAIPDNVVSPSLLRELRKAGVPISESGKVKYSMSDSTGRQITKEQQKFFKDSAVRDESGNLKVMYHGTSAGGHTVFDPYGKARYGLFGAGSYFTDSKTIAESYTKKGKGNSPQVYETYLNIKNPMDMDAAADPAAWAEAFPDASFPESGTNEDFYRAMEDYFEDNEYPRWEAAEAAMEAIEVMGYDGITHIGGGRVRADSERHRVYIAFQPEQIKSVDNTKPTADPDIRFSMSETVEKANDLVALHNLTAEKLSKSLALGGMPMPSLAITKADIPHDNFGEITLIFGKETIDPKANRKNKIYSADAWTPVFPPVEYEADSKVGSQISKNLGNLAYEIDDSFRRDLERLQYGFEDYLNSYGGEEGLIRHALENYGLKAAYLEEQGKHIDKVTVQEEVKKDFNPKAADKYLKIMDILGVTTAEEIGSVNLKDARDNHGAELEAVYPGVTANSLRMARIFGAVKSYLENKDSGPVYTTVTDSNATRQAVDDALDAEGFENWTRNLFAGIVKDSGIYNNKERYTPSGNRRSFKQLHLPVTLENIVKAMAGQNNGNAKNVSGFNGVKTLRAATAETFKSVDAMHKRKGRLQHMTQEQAEALNNSLQERLYKVIDTIDNVGTQSGERNRFIRFDSIGETLAEIGEGGKYNVADIQETFRQYGKEISDDTAMEVKQLLYDVTQMPVNIFEAKPQRVVSFDEAKAFVVPNNLDAKLKQELLNRGYSIAEYDPNVEGDRQRVVNQFEELKFSLASSGGEVRNPSRYDVYGKDFRVQEEVAPVAETSTVAENATVGDVAEIATTDEEASAVPATVSKEDMVEMFPDELEPAQMELDRLNQQRDDLEARMLSMADSGDFTDLEAVGAQHSQVMERIAELEGEISESDDGRMDSITDEDAPPEMDAPYYGEPSEPAAPVDPFEDRDISDVGNRKVKAYQYENPEVKPFFMEAALGMLDDLSRTTKGEKIFNDQVYYESGGEDGWMGTKRSTTSDIAELLDVWNYSYAQIEKGLNAIIEDDGKENNAVSKRIEFMLNDRLMNGYTGAWGEYIHPNQGYIDLLNEKQITEYSKEAFDSFMATADQYAQAEDIAPAPAPVQTVPMETALGSKEVSGQQTYIPHDATYDAMPDDADIGPTAELASGQKVLYEPINPRKQPKMVRVDKAGNEQVAQVLVEEPEPEKKRNKLWSMVKENVLDNGMVFEDLALKTKNRDLQAKWNFRRYAQSMAQRMVGNGANGVKSLNAIREEVEQTGKVKQFYEYLYHRHNADRMRLEERYEDVPNKPVFGYNVTADHSDMVAREIEQANPNFRRYARDVYKYMNHLRSMMVNNGIISQDTANLWAEMYPHYVPIRRAGDNGLNINVPLDTGRTGVNAPVKRATGGNSDILPLFDTMGQRTMQTFRAIANNSFGVVKDCLLYRSLTG